MPRSFPSRQDASLMVALVVAAVMAAMSARPPEPAGHDGSETTTSAVSQVAQHRSPLIDDLNVVGAANDAAEPALPIIAALLSP